VVATTLDRTADLGTDLVEIYRLMLLTRTFDERITLLSHQGRVAISASVRGHEAALVPAPGSSGPARTSSTRTTETSASY
jgi:TPP-dependent pyruvate/acetoin dehydrogenase alpha subunit